MSLLDRAARFIDDVLLLPDDVRERVEEAEHALRMGELGEAEAMLREVLAVPAREEVVRVQLRPDRRGRAVEA